MNSSAVYTGIPAMIDASTTNSTTMSDCCDEHSETVDGSSFRGDTSRVVNMNEFRAVTRVLGFLLGLLTLAADLSGQVFLLRATHHHPSTFVSVFLFIGFWSTLWSIIMWTVLTLICRMLEFHPRCRGDDMIKVVETSGMLWAIFGVAFGCTLLDAYFLPPVEWLCSVSMMVTVAGMFKLFTMCFPCCFRCSLDEEKECHVEDGVDLCDRLMIV